MRKSYVLILALATIFMSFTCAKAKENQSTYVLYPTVTLQNNSFSHRYDSNNPGDQAAYGYITCNFKVYGSLTRTSTDRCYGASYKLEIGYANSDSFTPTATVSNVKFTFSDGDYYVTYTIRTNVFSSNGSDNRNFTYTKRLAIA